MSVGIGNIYTTEIDNETNNWELNQNKYNNSNIKDNIKNDNAKTSLNSNSQKDDINLPNVIKEELLELSFVARELSTKLSSSNSTNNVLIKQVSEIVDAYFSHLNIIKQQYNFYINNTINNDTNADNVNNNSIENNINFQSPVVTSLMNLKVKIDNLLDKLKSWNNAYIKWWYNVSKLNKYFERIEEEWRNLLLNISVNNLSTSYNMQMKKENEASLRNKNLEKNPLEIYITGEKYFYGIGNEKSYTTAYKKYYKAAEYGMPEAMYMLGLMYEKGYGVSIDICMAIHWYNEAIKFNYGKAFNSLGNIYENGIGVQRNDKKAYEFYKSGADVGDISCYTSL
eukprot:jgi/Orpsp1_1/1189801/evm.model.d7180000074585.1